MHGRICPDNATGLIKEIVELYHEARTPLYPHDKVERGESRSVFAQTEDLFACYFGNKFSTKLDKVLINQNLILKGAENRKPDITLIRGEEAKVFVDLKMDLGFKRNGFNEIVESTEVWLETARGKPFHYFAKATGRTPIEAAVGQGAIWLYIVISNSNMGKCLIPLSDSSTGVETHVVIDGFHPNTYSVSKRFAKTISSNLTPSKTLEKDAVMGILDSNYHQGITSAFEKLHRTISTALDSTPV